MFLNLGVKDLCHCFSYVYWIVCESVGWVCAKAIREVSMIRYKDVRTQLTLLWQSNFYQEEIWYNVIHYRYVASLKRRRLMYIRSNLCKSSGVKSFTSVIVILPYQLNLYIELTILEQYFHVFPQRQWKSGKEKIYSIINGLSSRSSQLRRTIAEEGQLHDRSKFSEVVATKGESHVSIEIKLTDKQLSLKFKQEFNYRRPVHEILDTIISKNQSIFSYSAIGGQLSTGSTFLLLHLVVTHTLTYSLSVFSVVLMLVKYGLFFHCVMIRKTISSIVLDWHSLHLIKAE